ncbi:MAG TPA: IS66 family transposase [Ktedonobacterales bacterium]|jgi:transposase|nr:IS66 family transposase [Ktedonobacterales bacterium]
MTPDARIAELEAVVEQQCKNIERLLNADAELGMRIRELEARLANASKDSHNSSKPPSSDGLGRKTRSLRKKSGKKPGGQLGHRGETLRLAPTPDEVVEQWPGVCAHCHTALSQDTPLVGRERRQKMYELPSVRLQIREYQALHVRCPACQHITCGTFPAEAASRAQYGPRLRAVAVYLVEHQLVPYARVRGLLTDLFGAHVSPGTLVRWVRHAAQTLEPVEAQIKAALRRAAVLHSDETGVRRTGRLVWAHVTSTSRLTHYAMHPKRGSAATEAIGILPTYAGVSVHDGWAPYRASTTCRHALCNIHHLRELTFLDEQYHQAWAKDLKGLLLDMKAATAQARAQRNTTLPAALWQTFVARYETFLAAGLAANPPPERSMRRRGRIKQSPARNVLERLYFDQEAVLAFLGDLTIPFDNNQAERDLRMLKVQQKVSGSFRSEHGAAAFARIRGYLSTLGKQGASLLDALEALFAGQPLHPSFA